MMDNREQENDLSEENLLAALCYIPFLVLYVYLLKRPSLFIRWHSKQGVLMLGLVVVILSINQWVPRVGNLLFFLWLIALVVAMTQALVGRRWRIPLVGVFIPLPKV